MENNEEKNVVDEEQKEIEVKEENLKEQSAPIESTPTKKPGLYTAGLVCGIVGLCLFWSTWIGLICGVLGIVFGAITFSKTNNKTPIILGSIATVLALIMMIVYPILIKNIFHKAANNIQNELKEVIETTTDEEGKNIFDKIDDAMEDAVDEAEEEKTKAEEKMNDATNQIQQEYDSAKEDINNSMDEVTKKAQDVFNNIAN